MSTSEMHKEISQVREVESLNIARLGFITVNGFEKQESEFLYYTGEDLYR